MNFMIKNGFLPLTNVSRLHLTAPKVKNIYFVIYGIISDFTDKGQFQYITNLKGPQEGTYLYTTQFLSLRLVKIPYPFIGPLYCPL